MALNPKFQQWEDLYQQREDSFKKLNPSLATIIFLDGRSVTGNHKRYDLFKTDPIYKITSECALQLVTNINVECTIYSAADECSLIFPDTQLLMDAFQMDDCGDYILSLLLQCFLKSFWNYYPNILMKATIFQCEYKDIQRYINYHIAICQNNAMWWMAKEMLDKTLYKNLEDDTEKLIEILKKEELYNTIIENEDFYNGILLMFQPPNFMDSIMLSFYN